MAKEGTGKLVQFRISMPKLPENFGGALYANQVQLVGTDNELFLDFVQVNLEVVPQPEARGVFLTRVALPWPVATRLAEVLQDAIATREQREK